MRNEILLNCDRTPTTYRTNLFTLLFIVVFRSLNLCRFHFFILLFEKKFSECFNFINRYIYIFICRSGCVWIVDHHTIFRGDYKNTRRNRCWFDGRRRRYDSEERRDRSRRKVNVNSWNWIWVIRRNDMKQQDRLNEGLFCIRDLQIAERHMRRSRRWKERKRACTSSSEAREFQSCLSLPMALRFQKYSNKSSLTLSLSLSLSLTHTRTHTLEDKD